MAILHVVKNTVSLFCSVREFIRHSIYQKEKKDSVGTPALLNITLVADFCRPGVILEDVVAELALRRQIIKHG